MYDDHVKFRLLMELQMELDRAPIPTAIYAIDPRVSDLLEDVGRLIAHFGDQDLRARLEGLWCAVEAVATPSAVLTANLDGWPIFDPAAASAVATMWEAFARETGR